ncbi:MAG TPA: Type 1 glutamine amidotransferase-like domain-containing protein [Candidatus Binatia bacterium]|jgi:peptidase E|nr:Type 1 glutamine amidotransferase-like domain-containing protein [Candidatus Binatia bacterium]
MNSPLQPIYLFADSQLLFWKNKGTIFLQSIRETIDRTELKAAYIGASNGDDPEFYSIFEGAMESIGIQDCKMILSSFPSDDESFVKESDIILLAGGDVEKGWNAFTKVGLKELIIKRYYEGALLIGVSAGAVQLGLFGVVQDGSANKLIDTFKLIPFVIGAHEEKEKWNRLTEAVQQLNGSANGIGIPSGGGMVYHPDHSIEAIRYPLYEFSLRDGLVSDSLLIPKQEQ